MRSVSRPQSYPLGQNEVCQQTSILPTGSKWGLSIDLNLTQRVKMRSVDRPHFDPLGRIEVCSIIFRVRVYKFSLIWWWTKLKRVYNKNAICLEVWSFLTATWCTRVHPWSCWACCPWWRCGSQLPRPSSCSTCWPTWSVCLLQYFSVPWSYCRVLPFLTAAWCTSVHPWPCKACCPW